MTRLWIRNLTSRNDSRTGAWVIRRPDGADAGGPPAGAPGPGGTAGTPGPDAGPEPGRALSILLSSDIATDPLSPQRGSYHRHDNRDENHDFFCLAFFAKVTVGCVNYQPPEP